MKRGRWIPVTAAVWLLIQIASAAAAPFLPCCGSGHEMAATEHACCADMAPGEICPVHGRSAAVDAHHTSSAESDEPAVRCQCRVSSAAVAFVLLGQAVLPPPFALPYDPTSLVLQPVEPAGPAYVSSADAPPPRA